MSFSDAKRAVMMREGGAVKRCHTMSFIGHHDNAQHQYNALSLALIMEPDMSLQGVKALLWHDVPERVTGDSPHGAKRSFPDILQALYNAEDLVREPLGIPARNSSEIPAHEWELIKVCDQMEFWMWCIDQTQLGNKMASGYASASDTRISGILGNVEGDRGARWRSFWDDLKIERCAE